MKRLFILFLGLITLCGCDNKQQLEPSSDGQVPTDVTPTVYMTQEISPAALVRIYEALGRPATGRVAVKISTSEPDSQEFLQPRLIQQLVNTVNGTLVECNTDYDSVGTHLKNYDFMINLAHFKGHAMGGFGGVLNNQSMVAAAQAVHDYFGNGERIIYINVLNNLSVDCDCDAHPADPEMANIGILASLDPVALDQACVDLVFNYPSQEKDDASALIERINSRHGIQTIEHAEKIGLGSRKYNLVSIDADEMLKTLNDNKLSLLVRNHGVTTQHGQRGIQDLLELIQKDPNRLKGAVCADKIIGKAAASLMIVGGVKEVRTNIICEDAKKLLEQNGVKIVADTVVPMILNRDQSGQCPMDSKLVGVQTADECVEILKNVQKNR